MKKPQNKPHSQIRTILELIGKPSFFLFTTTILTIYSVLGLFTFFIHKLVRFTPPSKHFSLTKLRYPKWALALVLTFTLISSLGWYIYSSLLWDLPSPQVLRSKLPALSTKIYDRNGKLLYQIYRDENRSLIKLSELPPHVIQATIASEDKNFYRHQGLDFRGILRAIYANLLNCKFILENCSLQGGSTITQQLVKNALLSPEQTVTRKLKEAYLSIWTESLFSKDEILELYFNYVPYGGTAYGIEEASRQYFGKSAVSLTLEEATLLAGLPVAPTTFSPFGTRPYLAKNRQSQVLDAMVTMGYLTSTKAALAKSNVITFRPQRTAIQAPHFVMYVKDLLAQQLGEDLINRGGLEVTTTLDLDKQHLLETEISRELAKLQNMHVTNAAGLITSPMTGEVLAMVGSHDFFDTAHDGQVNVTIEPRQPGSSIKPITYTLAFMNGLTPNSRIEDSPICFTISGSPNYCPKNYDGRFHGRVTATTALASSYNIPAIKLLNSLGVDNLITLARRMGITTWDDPSRFGLSLTLGGGEVKMTDMAVVYGIFANQGTKVSLNPLLSVKNHLGQELTLKNEPVIQEVIPPSVAYQISSILSSSVARAPAFGSRSILNIPNYPVAVKTGTTNNLRDNWTFGYTPDLLVATWVGNNDNTPMSSVASGITGASPIWSRTMQQLLSGSDPRPFTPPESMVKIAICPPTGQAYCQKICPTRPKIEYYVKGTEPKIDCTPKEGDISLSGTSTTNQ